MKRTPSAPRAPSPTNTTFSGISNYRTESYKPLRDRARNASIPQLDAKAIAKVHFDEMAVYLENHLAKELPGARASAREKLTRLTKQQFQELSTDVYDELIRRKNNTENEEVPFLPVRDDFHPKRNQARQKLATLPKARFKDLSGDVYFELGRRYPEFREPEILDQPSPSSNYDDLDVPSPDFPQSMKGPASVRSAPTDSGYGGSNRRPSEEMYRRRPGDDSFSGRSDYGASSSSRRKASVDTIGTLKNEERRRASPEVQYAGRRSDEADRDRDIGRRPSGSISTTSDSTTNATNAQREMIIPNKSTIAEEEIEVPYGRERESSSMALGRISRSPDVRERSPELRGDTDGEGVAEGEPDSARSPPIGLSGLSGLSARLQNRTGDEDDEDAWSGPGKSGEEYYDKMSFGRASVASDRSVGYSGIVRATSTGGSGRASKAAASSEDTEGIRREYEFKIATMQNRITGLERELEDAEERARRLKESAGEEKIGMLEAELRTYKDRNDEQASIIRNLKRDLEDEKEERSREQAREARRAKEDADEIESMRRRIENMEQNRLNDTGESEREAMDQLRSDFESLMSELNELSLRNDELMSAKDSDLVVIQNLDAQLKEYKRKYEAAKTELRSFKATSQLFLPTPKVDSDQLPMSPDGGILDVHITAFLSATDSLLTAGRANAPSRVLAPMKTVVNAVSAIIEDVRLFEQRKSRNDIDIDNLHSLRERAEATLSNLVTATKTHATSMGMSPVSLLDAASSHLSVSITELGKTVHVRKATKAEQDQFNSSLDNNHLPSSSLRNSEDLKFHHRLGSASFLKREEASRGASASSPSRGMNSRMRRPPSPSSSNSSSPPPLFDRTRVQNTGNSDDSAIAESPDDAWAELKPYLEAQSEQIVYAIQSVLSGVRSPMPSPTLNENLAQIITIVSSIVAVCKDCLPSASEAKGTEILQELGEHANKLSEVQNMRDVTKESRQAMAKSSFAVANAMKELMKL